MSTPAVIRFDNLLEEARYAFRAGDFAWAANLLGEAMRMLEGDGE